MNLFSYKSAYADVFANEFCFYMILASCFRRTQCASSAAERQLSLYYADLVRDSSGYDRKTGEWKVSCSFVRQERMEDLYIPLIENDLSHRLSALGWDLSGDQAEVFIDPAMKIEEITEPQRACGRKSSGQNSDNKPGKNSDNKSGLNVRKTSVQNSRKKYAVSGHRFRFVGLYHELAFQITQKQRLNEIRIRVRGQNGLDEEYLFSVRS